MMQNRWLRCLCVIISVSFVLTLAPSRLSAADDIVNFYSVSENLEYDVDVTIVSAWDTYANLEFTITNTGTETIHNWYFTFDLPYIVEGIWNAYVFETVNGVFTIKNAGWNQDIQANSTVNFGMTVSSLNGQPIDALPSFYLLNITETTVDPSCYTLSYQEYSNWGSGFNGALVITNISAETIEDWSLFFSTNREITEVSGADLDTDDNIYHVSNNDSNQTLAPYSNVNLTVNGSGLDTNNTLVLNSVALKAVSCAFSLTEDVDSNGIVDYVDFINGKNTDPDISPTPTPTVTPTDDPSITPTPDVSLTPSITPIPDLSQDSDEDGIPDYYEIQIGTDPYSNDTDEDEIEDGIEILLNLDPLSTDTNCNEISDGQEDEDGDGLSLLQEMSLGTYSWEDDSDVDGLLDGDEIFTYGTDPMDDDTDDDGIEDGDEVKLGTDPLLSDSDGDSIPDGEERFLQSSEKSLLDENNSVLSKVVVELSGTGYIGTSLTIRNMYGVDSYCSSLVGLVGIPVDFSYDKSFDEALLSFYYDEAELDGVDENDLCLVWFDSENGEFILLEDEQVLDTDNNVVSYSTTHFSEYMLISKTKWFEAWNDSLQTITDLREESERNATPNKRDYFICVQTCGGDSKDFRYDEWGIFNSINSALDPEHFNLVAVMFYSYDLSGYLVNNDRQNAWIMLANNIYEDLEPGPPDMSHILSCMPQLSLYGHDDSLFFIITDLSEIDVSQEVELQLSQGSPLDIYIISTQQQCLSGTSASNISFLSSGDYSDLSEELSGRNLSFEIDAFDLYGDEDNDGLTNIQEQTAFLLTNGNIVYTDWQNPDTDADDLIDGVEIGEEKTLGELGLCNSEPFASLFDQYVDMIPCWTYRSSPADSDSDDDGFLDGEDASPLIKNPYANYILFGPETDYGDLESEAYSRKKKFEKNGEIAFVIPIAKREDFAAEWGNMGFDSSTGKYAYSIDEVVIISHGYISGTQMSIGLDSEGLDFVGDDGVWYRMYSPNELKYKKINTLNLASCYSGSLSNLDENMAVSFLFSKHDINYVIGWDGQTKYAHLPSFNLHDISISYDEAYSGEYFWSDYKGKVVFHKLSEEEFEYSYSEWEWGF